MTSFTTFVWTVRLRVWRWRRRLSTRRFGYAPMQAKRISCVRDIFIADTAITTALLRNWKSPARRCRMTRDYSSSRVMLSVAAQVVIRKRHCAISRRRLTSTRATFSSYTRLHRAANHARRYAEEEAVLDRLLAIEPNDADTQVWRAFVEFDWKADTRSLHQVIDEIRVKNPAALQGWVTAGFTARWQSVTLLPLPML